MPPGPGVSKKPAVADAGQAVGPGEGLCSSVEQRGLLRSTVTRKERNRLCGLAAQRQIQYYSSGTDCRVTITTCMPFGCAGMHRHSMIQLGGKLQSRRPPPTS